MDTGSGVKIRDNRHPHESQWLDYRSQKACRVLCNRNINSTATRLGRCNGLASCNNNRQATRLQWQMLALHAVWAAECKMGDVQILYLVSTLRWQWLEKARLGRILWKELNCGLNNNWRLYYFNLLFGDNKLSEQKHWFVITRISFSTTTSVIRFIISISL